MNVGQQVFFKAQSHQIGAVVIALFETFAELRPYNDHSTYYVDYDDIQETEQIKPK